MRSDRFVNSPQANKERTFHVNMLVESLCILRKNTFYNCFSASGLSCSYKSALTKKGEYFNVC